MSTQRSNRSSSEASHAAGRSVVFWVGKRCLALPIDLVREIVDLQRVCPVPRAPAAVLGIMSLRGTILAVLDTGHVLAGAVMSATDAKVLVMVRGEAVICGLAVHRIHGVVAIPTGAFLHSHVADPSPFVLGYHDLGLGDLVEVIDVDRLLRHVALLRADGEARVATL